MKSRIRFSTFALLLIAIVCLYERNAYPTSDNQMPIKVTTWDALGYYLYLPATFIYHDIRGLSFYDSIEKKYHLQGEENNFYQFQKNESGFYTGKYFVGVAVLQLPFFLMAHGIAKVNGEADGFSSIYQKGIAYGAIFWAFISLIVLRRFLLNYYNDLTVGIGLILAILGTNAIQYIAVDNCQSHAWIFPLYVYILVLSDSWYKRKTILKSIGIGILIGFAMLCRPTEGVILFIPLLWGYPKNEFSSFVKLNWVYFLLAGLGMFCILSIQLMYWKYTTNHWVFDVGSKWDFLSPHFRVLFGEEKGRLLYTPICLLMLIGLFFIGKEKFSLSIRSFMLLNIWIVIAWHIWRYGGSYSARALVQSTPIMLLPMLAILQKMLMSKLKIIWGICLLYFLCLNLFQVFQYNTGILHCDRNTWAYYQRIYWKVSVSEEDKKYLQEEAK